MGKYRNQYGRLHPTMRPEDLDFTKSSMPRAAIRLNGSEQPSTGFVELMNSAAEGIQGVEAVIKPSDRAFIVFSSGLDAPTCREIFGQFSNTVMRLVAGLSPKQRDDLLDKGHSITEYMATASGRG